MNWYHPKYYAELRKLRAQALKRSSSQADEPQVPSLPSKAQASSQSQQAPGSDDQGTSEPSPCPGNKQQG
jgi:hypothetical protein